MAKNNGKKFEKNIKNSCEKQGILFERLPDNNKFGGGDADLIFKAYKKCMKRLDKEESKSERNIIPRKA